MAPSNQNTEQVTHMKTQLTTLTLLTLAATPAAFAAAGPDQTTVGFGVVTFEAPYEGYKDDVAAHLYVQHKSGNFSVDERGLNYRVLGDDQSDFALHLTLTSTGMGYEAGDADVLAGMADRDTSLDIGISADYQLGMGQLRSTLVQDVIDAHDGYVAGLYYQLPYKVGNGIVFTPAAGVSYASKEYVNYYFGVENSEATAKRSAYSSDSGALNGFIGYRLDLPIKGDWSLIHEAHYAKLGGEISDSSLVDRDSVWTASLAVGYTF